MKLIPALQYEKIRQDSESWNKIICHKEGRFYHIYEWSAWLVKKFLCTEEFQKQRGDNNILSAFRYQGKDVEYVMIGFPLESLSKYIHTYADVKKMENDDLTITIDMPLEGNETEESLRADFEEWKQSCLLKEKKAKSNREISNSPGGAATMARSGMFQILSTVLSYPVERSTPAENLEFISKLKQQLASLL